jgi:hypothetical protein
VHGMHTWCATVTVETVAEACLQERASEPSWSTGALPSSLLTYALPDSFQTTTMVTLNMGTGVLPPMWDAPRTVTCRVPSTWKNGGGSKAPGKTDKHHHEHAKADLCARHFQ